MTLAKRLRCALLRATPAVDDVAVLLSSGTDSMCALFALLENGACPRTYSFCMRGEEARFDPVVAAATARAFCLEHVIISLPGDDMLRAARRSVLGLGLRKKTDVECAWPVAEAMQRIPERVIVSGHAGDGHFGLTKRAMIHCVNDVAALDAERDKAFTNPNYAQIATLRRFAATHGKTFVTPWREDEIVSLFRGHSWREINRPRQKETARAAFEEYFARANAKKHSDLHAGGTGIKEAFESLLSRKEFRHHKSTVAIYNRLSSCDLPVLIGQAPSQASDPAQPLADHGFADKIAKLLCVDVLTYLASFERWNLLDSCGDAFPMRDATQRVREILPFLQGRDVVVFGRLVTRAFGLNVDWLRWVPFNAGRIAAVPYPSGIDRWWNDATNVIQAGRFLRALLKGD